MCRGIKARIIAAARSYPLKRRAASALVTCFMLLVLDMNNWQFQRPILHFESWRVIILCAGSVAWLFEPWGRWNMFFLGVAFGDLLLYAAGGPVMK